LAIALLFLAAIAILINGALAWHAQSRLDRMVADLHAAGEPTSLKELAPKPVAAEKNAATYLVKISGDLDAFSEASGAFEETEPGKQWWKDHEDDKLPKGAGLVGMRELVDKFPAILPALARAAACSEYASPADFSMPPTKFIAKNLTRIQQFRILANYVYPTMLVLAAEGKADEAVRIGIQLLKVSRLNNEPLLVNHLVTLAVRGAVFQALGIVLQHDKVSAESAAALAAELAHFEGNEGLLYALKTERAYSIPALKEQTGRLAAFLRWPMLNFLLKEVESENAIIEFVQRPLDQIEVRVEPSSQRLIVPAAGDLGGTQVAPGLVGTVSADVRSLAMARCLRVLLALAEYRQKFGKEAETIEQLSLPREFMIDPAFGKPLKMKKQGTGWLIYSIGPNGVDDGGKMDLIKGDYGISAPKEDESSTKSDAQ